jgi:hypothetical protein
MFGFFKSKQADVISHWYALVPGFNTSTKEFYEAVEKELKEREVPGLEISRVEFSEGGILSDKRVYLRMIRERLVFDVCAAPFGKAYFFSCRFAEIPAVIHLWQLLVLAAAFGICAFVSFIVCAKVFGGFAIFVWPVGWIILIALLVYVLRNAVAMRLQDLDTMLIRSPVFGPIYERWFRRETYYRHDTRLMYCDTVDGMIRTLVEEITAAKGVKLVQFKRHSPVFDDLYKPLPPKEPSK